MQVRSQVFFLLIAAGLVAAEAAGQQQLFQSASGDTAIFLPQGGQTLSYNLGSDAARFDWLGTLKGGQSLGGGFGGTIKSGTGDVINKNAPASGFFGEGGLSFKIPDKTGDLEKKIAACASDGVGSVQPGDPHHCHARNGQFFVGQFHYGRTQFYNLGSATAPVPSPTQINFNQFQGTAALNMLRTNDWFDLRVGAAYVTGTSNNLADLTQETYQPQVTTTTSTGQSILSGASKSVYVGAYKTHIAQDVNVDFVVQPNATKGQVAFDAMLRSDFGGGSGVRYASPGIGAFFFAAGKPIVPVVGVSYTYRAGNNQVAISAGWSFGGVSTKDTSSGGGADKSAAGAVGGDKQ